MCINYVSRESERERERCREEEEEEEERFELLKRNHYIGSVSRGSLEILSAVNSATFA